MAGNSTQFPLLLLLPLLSIIFLSILAFASASSPPSSLDDDDSAIIFRFQQYLQINTSQPTPDYSQSTSFLLSLAKTLALESETLEFTPGKPLVVLKWPGKDPTLPSILLNSHTDVVPAESTKWAHPPFSAHIEGEGRIYARGSQDMKCVGMQYLEAIRRLKSSGFEPIRTVYISFVPDEEIPSKAGMESFVASEKFAGMNVGIVLDEGLASADSKYRAFYAERCPWWLVIRAVGEPGHGSKLYDNSAVENLMKSIERVKQFHKSQFDMVKAGLRSEGEVISANMVFLKAGTPSSTGFVMNLQPSEVDAGFDIRVPPNANEESLEKRIAEEWAPSFRNMSFVFKQKVSTLDMSGKPALTMTDSSNPWWTLLEEAVKKAGGKLKKPEIFPASTDSRFFRQQGLPAIGFSPMANTPILLHDHDEFLSKAEYLKGIKMYESIVEAYASYVETSRTKPRDEL